MNRSEYKVYNLLDPDQREEATQHVKAQMDRTQQDISLVAQAEDALAEVHFLLLEMKELAQKAMDNEADRKMLNQKYLFLKDRIDDVADRYLDALSKEDAERLMILMKIINPDQKQA